MSHEAPKYPRRFIAAPGVFWRDTIAYAEIRSPGENWWCVFTDGSAVKADRDEGQANVHVAIGDWIETFDHHELHAPPEAKAFDPATDVWPRTFEAVMDGSVCRVVFNSKDDTPRDIAVRGRQVGARGYNWSWEEVIRDVGSTKPTAWHEVPSYSEITTAELTQLRQSLAESHEREKQERALRAEAERREAAIKALLTESRWFVVDYAGISHNPHDAKCARELAERIDAAIFPPIAEPSGEVSK